MPLPAVGRVRWANRRRLEFDHANERVNILSALREKPLKVYEIMKRANISNEEACQSTSGSAFTLEM